MLPEQRVAFCLRTLQSRASGVDVWHLPASKSARYGGLIVCGSVWACPVCSCKISERRRVELREAVKAVEALGGRVVMVTTTIRHKRSDDLSESIAGILRARELMKSGSSWMKIRRDFGVLGSVRALEVTHGRANGWHVHIHELLFISAEADLIALERELKSRWDKVLSTAGLRGVNQHGCQLDAADMTVADYIAKFGHERTWGAESELTKAVSKRGRAAARTPVDLLADYTFYGDKEAGVLFREYALAFKGKRQLAWSPGLRDLLGMEQELTDEEVVEREDEEGVLLAQLTREDWKVILRQELRAHVLEVASLGDVEALRAYLVAIGCPDVPRDEEEPEAEPELPEKRTDEDWYKLLPVGLLAGEPPAPDG